MADLVNKLMKLDKVPDKGYFGERIYSELQYAVKISDVDGGKFNGIIDRAMDYVLGEKAKAGMVNEEICKTAESILLEIAHEAKKYKLICAAHAHIDMNWMWRWDETVSVALDTFRTMLNLMDEYPEFKFSQSQASVYRIMEEYAPDMADEVRKRIKEGRWEVTAATWVECDKNMPCGESLARHILYTKKYLSNTFDLNPDRLKIDFEPDTFGHSVNIPEILANGGVKYYYHCRGCEGHTVYRWVAPSGKSVIAYHEPYGYNSDINPSIALCVPEFCKKYNLDAMLKVYGVGDHGGGPTRRDIERIIDMDTWPVFPQIKFGTFNEFFNYLDNSGVDFPEVRGELNFVFTGCYTTQTRIKAGNRKTEAALNEAEAYSALSAVYTGSEYRHDSFSKAWENVMFNQFHDIIPGSGRVDTREYSMGLYQKALADANSEKSRILRNIANLIDTREYMNADKDFNMKESVSEGAGAGFGVSDFKISQCERGNGITRVFTVFNPAPFKREENTKIMVWDWQGDIKSIVFIDSEGRKVPYMLLKNGFSDYWGHSFVSILLRVKVPACGYATYIMDDSGDRELKIPTSEYPRVEKEDYFILENKNIKVVFDKSNASIKSFIDKTNGEEMIDAGRPAGTFRLIDEDTDKGMTAWIVGRYMNITNLNQNVKIKKIGYPEDGLRKAIYYEIPFRNSLLKVKVSLDDDSTALNYDVECNWLEVGKNGVSVPQLNFIVPIGYEVSSYRYDVPFGTITREPLDMDVPANSWVFAAREEKGKNSLMIITDTKYGFRGYDNSMAVTLIRSSFDPDPYPELGVHNFSFEINMTNGVSNKELIKQAYSYNHPLTVISDKPHKGSFQKAGSFVSLEGGTAVLSSIKMSEDDNHKLIVRVYETEGKKSTTVLKFGCTPKRAYYVDINEKMIETNLSAQICGNRVEFEVEPYNIASICMEF